MSLSYKTTLSGFCLLESHILFTRSLLDLRKSIGEGKGKTLWGQSWLENEKGD
ncbi:MAG: Uncharacterised protein [Cellulomonadaceae bacterium TMED98]|nr:MAG: Uncharacterised protein [Cellulomonadaceae bacterium TMED98]